MCKTENKMLIGEAMTFQNYLQKAAGLIIYPDMVVIASSKKSKQNVSSMIETDY